MSLSCGCSLSVAPPVLWLSSLCCPPPLFSGCSHMLPPLSVLWLSSFCCPPPGPLFCLCSPLFLFCGYSLFVVPPPFSVFRLFSYVAPPPSLFYGCPLNVAPLPPLFSLCSPLPLSCMWLFSFVALSLSSGCSLMPSLSCDCPLCVTSLCYMAVLFMFPRALSCSCSLDNYNYMPSPLSSDDCPSPSPHWWLFSQSC